jgi:transposase
MLGLAMYITIETLWKKGCSKAEIARLTGHDWKTVAKVIKQLQTHHTYPVKKPHPNKLDPYKVQIGEWLSHNYTALKIYEALLQQGVKTSYSATKHFVAQLKQRESICIRFHTLPGEEAQVDFGYVGLTRDKVGKRRKTWIFNMRLSYSRLDFYCKVYDQTVETFIDCHIKAFAYFGGVPHTIKLDNLKAAILAAHFYEPIYQQLYKQMADYYGFQPLPCRVRQPQEKGKVEAGIKYFKRNFLIGRTFKDGDDFDQQLQYWLTHICNSRIHGTTQQRPQDLFEREEKSKLRPLPAKPFSLPEVGQRTVYHDCHVYIHYNYYSVPFAYVGKAVDIELDRELVRIRYQGNLIATHKRCQQRGQFSTYPEHYPKYQYPYSTEQRQIYQQKMQQVGEHAEQLFLQLVKTQPHTWYRITQGILSLTRQFSKAIVNAACQRALVYDVLQYRTIKNMCENGSYQLPLDPQPEGEASRCH